MKRTLPIGLPLFLCSVSCSFGQTTLLSDNFPGTSLNTSNWIARTPVPGASVTVDNGLILADGGDAVTQSGFPETIRIAMSFEFTGTQYDSFALVTRTDGTLVPGSVQFASGIVARFRMMSDPTDPTGRTDNVDLYVEDSPNSPVQLGIGTFAMTQDQTYNIELLENDSTISLFINDLSTPFLTGETTSSYGDLIGLNNREGAAAGSSISEGSQVTVESFSVSTVPDSGQTAAYLGIGVSLLAALACRGRHAYTGTPIGNEINSPSPVFGPPEILASIIP
jgi:hypothetical protein